MARILRRRASTMLRNEERLQVQMPLWAELNLLRSLVYAQPVFRVQTLSSFRAIKPGEIFHGCWIADTATGVCSSTGTEKDQATFESGFLMSFGGHHFMSSVWIGNTLQDLEEVCVTLGIEAADEALLSLVQDGDTVHFVRPDYPQHCPVYTLDLTQAANARTAGYLTEEADCGAKTKWREVQIGDHLVPLPPGGNWPRPMLVFPSNRLPEKRYRRV